MSDSDTEDVQAPQTQTQAKTKTEPVPKTRPPKTPAQMAAFKKAIETRTANAKRRKEEEARLEEEAKREVEDAVVKKAISIKKKQIKAKIALEEISDDDEPIEAVKQKVKKSIDRPQPKTVFTFV